MTRKYFEDYDSLRKTKEMIREYYPEFKNIEIKLEYDSAEIHNYPVVVSIEDFEFMYGDSDKNQKMIWNLIEGAYFGYQYSIEFPDI